MSELRVQVGNLVRHHREFAELSQANLAEEINKSVQLVGRIERGETAPSFETLEALSSALETPVRNFFGIGSYEAGTKTKDDPLEKIISRTVGMSHADLVWLDSLIENALARKPSR